MYGFQSSSGQNNFTETNVIDVKYGDVTGDGAIDAVYLTGERPHNQESPFVTNIRLFVQDGRSGMWYTINPKENSGYGPAIFLGDFTGSRSDDIMLSIFSGGSGGYTFYYIYSFHNQTPAVIFDFEVFNNEITYTVSYQDNYSVLITGSNQRTYTIDIRYKGEEYLSEIYDADGRLKQPVEGWVNPLGGLFPVDFQRSGVYGLYADQRIAGRYNADVIGYVQTSLQWDGQRFSPFLQTVGILG